MALYQLGHQVFSYHYTQLPHCDFNLRMVDHPSISEVITELWCCLLPYNSKDRGLINLTSVNNSMVRANWKGCIIFFISKFKLIKKWGLRARRDNKVQLFTSIIRQFNIMLKMSLNLSVKFVWALDPIKATYWQTTSRKDEWTWR